MAKEKVKVQIQADDEGKKEGLFSLFAKRKPIYQARVRGKFRRTKWAVMYPLLALYYGLPWIRWDRGEGAPDQAVMWDTVGRKLYFFYIEIWPQEVFLFTGLLLLAALALFFFTTLFGRVWCGYACPQTVWTDLFFIVERAIEGDRHRRIRLEKAPWTFNKIRLKATKHFIWLLIAMCTGGAWVFYFTDVPTFWSNLADGYIGSTALFWIITLTCSTYLLAGFAREQVCTYMCPYARFQGVMFDKDTLIVAYDQERGEPRGKLGGEGNGSCVDCNRCVVVCPTGIDIRNGQQYQCINCGLCVDACNEVMQRTNQPGGLIRYNSFNNDIKSDRSLLSVTTRLKLIRPRTIYYATIITLVASTLLYALTAGRDLIELNVSHSRNPLYIQLTNGDIRNVYKVNIVNKQHRELEVEMSVNGLQGAKLFVPRISHEATETLKLKVPSGKVAKYRLFVETAPGLVDSEKQEFTFKAFDGEYEDTYKTYFMRPSR